MDNTRNLCPRAIQHFCSDTQADYNAHVLNTVLTIHTYSLCTVNVMPVGKKKETRHVGDCSLIFYSSFTSGFHKIPPNSCALLTIVIIY